MSKLLPLFFLACVVLSGCTRVGDLVDDKVLRHQVATAYRAENLGLPKGKCARHFERGWKQGYYDAANGSPVIRPSVPTSVYLDPYYQSPCGRPELESWYSGYQNGSLAYRRQNCSACQVQVGGEVCHPNCLTNEVIHDASPLDTTNDHEAPTESGEPSPAAPPLPDGTT